MEKKNINIFNLNFFCKNEKSIIDIYTKKTDVIVFNNKHAFKAEKYNHPLFLNYNYCLFCQNKKKTKYYIKNLINIHNSNISLFSFMKNNNIKLKKPDNQKGKIIRRFIKSFEKNNNTFDLNSNSDTELYIEHNNEKINISNRENNDTLNSFKSKDFSSISLEKSKIKEKNIEKLKSNLKEEEKKEYIKFKKIRSSAIYPNNLFSKFTKTSKKKSHIILNKSSDNLIIPDNAQNGKDKTSSNQSYFSLIKDLAMNNFIKNRTAQKPNFRRKISENKKYNNNDNNIKNDKCSICLGEIKGKCTLICGDYFCKECITERVKNILKNVAEFDKMICPLCNEPIDKKTLQRLLNEDEFDFYEKIKMRIEGLKNKNLIPCPYPDCEGFADKNTLNKNSIFICQNNHYFCSKCNEVVDIKFILPKFHHVCINKYPKTTKYFNAQKKKSIIKKCPNCNCWVQKEQYNCNNVTCSNIWCNYEFCWICKSPYDENHYKNPFSICFGLSSINSENYFTKNKRMRILRSMIIILIFIFIILPFFVLLFSYVIILIFSFGFKPGMKNIKFKSTFGHKCFYRIFLIYCFLISIILIPFGHVCLILIIFATPFFILIKRMLCRDDFD